MVTKKGSISSDPSRLLPAAVTAPQVVTHHPVINCAHAVQVRPPTPPPLAVLRMAGQGTRREPACDIWCRSCLRLYAVPQQTCDKYSKHMA